MNETPANSDAEVTRLSSAVLSLPSVLDFEGARDLTTGSFYPSAIRTHAASLVDFLVQLDNSGVQRDNPVLAHFSTARGGSDQAHSDLWMHALSNGISDISLAAGLPVTIDGEIESAGWQQPRKFASLLDSLELPPALQFRIDARRDALQAELAVATGISKQAPQTGRRLIRKVDIFSGLTISRIDTHPISAPPVPAFTLQIATNDPAIDTALLSGQPYQHLRHTISLVTRHSWKG